MTTKNVLTNLDVISTYLINKGIKVTIVDLYDSTNVRYKEAKKNKNYLLNLLVNYLLDNDIKDIELGTDSVVSNNEIDVFIKRKLNN